MKKKALQWKKNKEKARKVRLKNIEIKIFLSFSYWWLVKTA